MSDTKSDETISFADLAALTAEVAPPGGGQGAVADAVNGRLITQFRANAGRVPGEFGAAVELLLLTVTGAKSGLPRVIPLAYFSIDERLVIVASMGGSPRHPTWYVNLKANPAVTVEVGAETFAARAVETTGADRDRLFDIVCERNPVFTTYQAKTERRIPVVELVRS